MMKIASSRIATRSTGFIFSPDDISTNIAYKSLVTIAPVIQNATPVRNA